MPPRTRSRDEADAFIELYVAQVSAPAIGRSLLGETGWLRLKERLKPGSRRCWWRAAACIRSRAPAMCAAASSTASKSSSTTPASLPRPRPPAPGGHRRRGRAGAARGGAVRGAARRPVRSGGAMAPATHGAARAQRLGQGLRDLRPGLRAAGCVYACGPGQRWRCGRASDRHACVTGPRPPARPRRTRQRTRPPNCGARSGTASRCRSPS